MLSDPVHEVDSKKNQKGQSKQEIIDYKLGTFNVDVLRWCIDKTCNENKHKDCDSINLHVSRDEWADWKKRHNFCPTCKRKG